MTVDGLLGALLQGCATAIVEAESELTALDQAIGDGDHGLNMARGFSAILALHDELATMAFGPALTRAGTTLVMKVGGASGPLFGSALMAMGKSSEAMPQDRHAVADLLAVGIEAVKSRGRSDIGAKTMLDVLLPVQQAIAAGADVQCIRKAANDAVTATMPMLATKGRASFLGERSIGHADPGGRSVAILTHAVLDALDSLVPGESKETRR